MANHGLEVPRSTTEEPGVIAVPASGGSDQRLLSLDLCGCTPTPLQLTRFANLYFLTRACIFVQVTHLSKGKRAHDGDVTPVA
jgi:hypothetical protein